MPKVTRAVIAAAGFGTRFLPQTKAIPKEMLPIVDKPVIHYVVEELVAAGVTDIIIVISPGKPSLVNYFSASDARLTRHLQASHKQDLLHELEYITNVANFTFVEQSDKEVYGTGTPVLCAEPYLNNEPFIFSFADDFFVAKPNSYAQLMDSFERYNAPVMGCQRRTADEDYDRYGYAGGSNLSDHEIDIDQIVERPGKAKKPGDLASFGGFIVTPEAIQYLRAVRADLHSQEFYFNSALVQMLKDGKRVVAREITAAQYYDTGNKLEYAKTVVAMSAVHPEIGADFRQYLHQFIKQGDHE